MNNDEGIYVLVSPTEKDGDKREYRVSYINSTGNITWELDTTHLDNAVEQSKIKSHFDKAKVYSDELDAKDEVNRILDEMDMTETPVFHIYMSTPYLHWSATTYAKNNRN
jgi:hypothetical protein